MPDAASALGTASHRAVDVYAAVGNLAGALARIDEKRGYAPVDVDPGVPLGRAGGVGQLVQLLLVLTEEARERLDECGPLVEGKRAQRRSPDLARIVQHRCLIQTLGAGAGDHRSGGRIAKRDPLATACLPAARAETLKLHVHSSPTTGPSMR